MSTINAAKVIGQAIYAPKTRTVKAYRLPNKNSEVLQIVPKGEFIGFIHSWVGPSTIYPALWWQFKLTDGSFFYVKHNSDLRLPNGQELLDSEKKDFFDRVRDTLGLSSLDAGVDSLLRLATVGGIAFLSIKAIEIIKK